MGIEIHFDKLPNPLDLWNGEVDDCNTSTMVSKLAFDIKIKYHLLSKYISITP